MMAGARVTPGMVKVIGWGLVYLSLAAVIGMEVDWGRSLRPSLPLAKETAVARADYPVQPEFTLPPLEQGFSETTARPMFTPVRRPPPPPAPPKPAMQKGQFVLLGALITKEKSIALLRDVATGKATRVELGKEIKGIMLANVLPEKVTLTQYDESEELVLKIQSSPKPPAAAFKELPQAAKPAAQATAVPTLPAAAPADENARTLINSRRAAHGLPPL